MYDFLIYGDNSLHIVKPQTDAARAWIKEHIAEDSPKFGGGVAVKLAHLVDVSIGILLDGLSIEKDGMEMFAKDGDCYLRPKPG